jgi:hypothetical protein
VEPGQGTREGIRQAEGEELGLGVRAQQAEGEHDQARWRGGEGRAGRRDRHQEPVSPPRERFDEPGRPGHVGERLADLPDAEIQALIEVHEGVVAPDLFADLGACHDLAAVPDQHLEHLAGLRLKLDHLAVSPELPGSSVEFEGPESIDGHRLLSKNSWETHQASMAALEALPHYTVNRRPAGGRGRHQATQHRDQGGDRWQNWTICSRLTA